MRRSPGFALFSRRGVNQVFEHAGGLPSRLKGPTTGRIHDHRSERMERNIVSQMNRRPKMTDELQDAHAALLWCLFLAVALLVFCAEVPL
jgi:hypothetical protein